MRFDAGWRCWAYHCLDIEHAGSVTTNGAGDRAFGPAGMAHGDSRGTASRGSAARSAVRARAPMSTKVRASPASRSLCLRAFVPRPFSASRRSR